MSLDGKVCVVTGASSGIGERTAQDLAARGAVVCLAARREERLQEVAGALGGEKHSYVVTDVSDHSQVERLAEHVSDTYGRCDVLVNNAGFSRGRSFRGTSSVEDVRAMMDTNFFGAVYCTAHLLPLLERAAPSHVVNVASVAGRVGFGNASGYCASKFALVGWSEGIRYELEPRGVHVGLVEPGPIPTEGFPQSDLKGHPLLRYVTGSVEDVSRSILGAIEGNKASSTVPGLYYFAQLPRIVAPPLFRYAVKNIVSRRAR